MNRVVCTTCGHGGAGPKHEYKCDQCGGRMINPARIPARIPRYTIETNAHGGLVLVVMDQPVEFEMKYDPETQKWRFSVEIEA